LLFLHQPTPNQHQPTKNKQRKKEMAGKQQKEPKPVFTSPFRKREVAAQIFGLAMQYFSAPKGGMFYFTFHLNQLRTALASCGMSTDRDVEEFVTHILIGYYKWYVHVSEDAERKRAIRAQPHYDPGDEPDSTPIDAMYRLSNAYNNLEGNLDKKMVAGAEIIGIAHCVLHKPSDAKGTIPAISMFVNGQWPLFGSDNNRIGPFIMALVGQLNSALSVAVDNEHNARFWDSTPREIVKRVWHEEDNTETAMTLAEFLVYKWKKQLARYVDTECRIRQFHMDVSIYTTDANAERERAAKNRKQERDDEQRRRTAPVACEEMSVASTA
jgi:hypothetical protein